MTHTTPPPTTHSDERAVSKHSDERAVSEILGAILVFGLLLALVVLIQLTAVPSWNAQVEFSHSERVADDMGDLGNAIERVQVGEGGESASIDLGVRHPARPFLVNPAPAEGTLQSLALGEVHIEGAQASGEVGDFWDGSPVAHDTRTVAYSPSYREFRDAPETIGYEHGTVAASYSHDATLVRQPRQVLSGTTINLVALTGTLDRSGLDRTSIAVTPMSRSPRTIAVTGENGEDITIELSTTLPEETWEDLLGAELAHNLQSLAYEAGDPATVTLTLDGSRTYDLRTALVGVGENPRTTTPSYLDRVQGGGTSIQTSGTDRLTVEVRDEFNAPKSGVEVTYEVVTGSGEFLEDDTPGDGTYTATSGPNGQTSVVFSPSSRGDVVVNATATLNDQTGTQEEERVRFAMTVPGPADGGGEIINPSDPASIKLDSVDRLGPRTVEVTFRNLASSPRQWNDLRVPFLSKQAGQPSPITFDITPEGKNTIVGHTVGDDFDSFTLAGSPSPLQFGPAGSPTATRTVTFEIQQGQGTFSQGDFFGVTVRDGNDNAVTYFVGTQ